ncbi:MAG TPA: hypothetical protein VGV59_05795 [Pyrinomonadaceae bacterium]|nr:hypothetical protein [Pyrinomonadaceae bacterium]
MHSIISHQSFSYLFYAWRVRLSWNEYKRSFQILHLQEGVSKLSNSDVLLFTVASRGTALESFTKGYAYSREELTPLSQSLDHIPSDLLTGKPVYKKLEGNWYLYYW